MARPAITVSGLSKMYQVGLPQVQGTTFYDVLSRGLRAPFERLRRRGTAPAHPQQFWALRDVGFELGQGEVLGIVGRNGAGKSTLLKILSRITAPTQGRISIRGRMSSLLEVGTGFHPELSGRENIFLNGALLGMTRADITRKFDAIVDFAEIGRFVDTPVKRYSSGMYVRLAFAVASHLEPDILVVDEVLAVGDFDFQRKCLGKMQDVSGDGRTVIFVSHNMPAIQSLCTRALWLERGEVAAAGDTRAILDGYLSGMDEGEGVIEKQTGLLRLLGARGECVPVGEGEVEVSVELRFASSADIPDLVVNFGLDVKGGPRLVHVISEARRPTSTAVRAGDDIRFEFKARMTRPAPGEFNCDIYAYSRADGVLLHQSGVFLFRIENLPDSPECMAPGYTGVLVPVQSHRTYVAGGSDG